MAQQIGTDVPGSSVGFYGEIDQNAWPEIAVRMGSPYGVGGPGDWRVTAVSGADRAVRVAAGSGTGPGVRDVTTAQATVQGTVVGSGSRWDTLVARRTWEPEGGHTTFMLLPGGTSKQIAGSRRTRAGGDGQVDDQPLALVRFTAGQQMATDIVDLRCWHGAGGMVAASSDSLAYLDAMGSRVSVGGEVWERRLNSTGSPVWTRPTVRAGDVTSGNVTRPVVNTATTNRMSRLTLSGLVTTTQRANVHVDAAGMIRRGAAVTSERWTTRGQSVAGWTRTTTRVAVTDQVVWLHVDWQRTGNNLTDHNLGLLNPQQNPYPPSEVLFTAGQIMNQNTHEVFLVEILPSGQVTVIDANVSTGNRLRGVISYPLV